MRQTIRHRRLRRPGIRGRRPIKTEIQKTTLKIMVQDKRQVVEITAEEMEEYKALKKKQEKEEQAQLQAEERKVYREMAMQTVDEMFPKVKQLNATLRQGRQEVWEAFEAIINAKCDLFSEKLREGQRSHSFMSSDGTKRIIIGRHQRDNWDDTVEAGIAQVKEYVSSLAKDRETETLVSMLLELLAKDRQGNLQVDKVLQLAKYAQESDSDLFKEGVRIIQESYRPELTKLFIRAEERGEEGKWVNIPLNITEA